MAITDLADLCENPKTVQSILRSAKDEGYAVILKDIFNSPIFKVRIRRHQYSPNSVGYEFGVPKALIDNNSINPDIEYYMIAIPAFRPKSDPDAKNV